LSFSGAIALLEEKGQVAGLELLSSHLLCHHPAYSTHLQDVVLVVHPDNFTSIATDPFDPEQITDYIRLETELSFLHVKTTISNRDRLRQVRLAICETRRQVAATRLEAVKILMHLWKCLVTDISVHAPGLLSTSRGVIL
jgi:hypothetical protein